MALGINVRVIVPVTCSCSGKFYQANTTYVVQHDDSYFIITNDIFRALTTCSAIKNQKVSSIIDIDERLTVPLRCACPTTSQINDGVRYLMTFVVHRADSVSSIADYYGANLEQTFEANEKSEQNYVIVPTTTLLVPLENPPYDDLSLYYDIQTYNRSSNSNIIVAVCVPTIIVLLLLFGVCFCIHRRKSAKHSQDLQEFMIEAESLRFDFKTIRSATNNFSQHNKLGQGGFGGVYKGKLQDGQEIAVKRLSMSSGQGMDEFKAEVVLVEKLQHNNLVKLMGFCVNRKEKLLVYELLPNASLDKMLQVQNRQLSLDWVTRYKILRGTARGLLYLHEDSRLKIIHRDLKPSNILLDENMNPKIADFGLARLFGTNQIQAETSKIAGTYGYMAPEYVLTGRFSIKSDVYSFGIIMLEIVSGHMCNSTSFPYEDESVCLRAWRLWKDGAILDFVDPRLKGNYTSEEVKLCIHIGLLCIQENAMRRPTMASIVAALNGHPVVLSEPEQMPYGSFINSQNGYLEDNCNSSIRFSGNIDDVTEIYPRW